MSQSSNWMGRTFAQARDKIPSALRDPLELLLAKNSVLRTTGWLRSRKQLESVDAQGEPLPWITYPALRFLAARVEPAFRVFEFGSGLSTLWWAARVKTVVSVEHDRDWHERIAARAPPNVSLILADADDYVSSASGRTFDIIINDGIRRSDCARSSIESLGETGVMLWDNTDEVSDRSGQGFMTDHGFRRLDFWGFGPLMVRESCTSVFYKPGNCLGI